MKESLMRQRDEVAKRIYMIAGFDPTTKVTDDGVVRAVDACVRSGPPKMWEARHLHRMYVTVCDLLSRIQ